MSSEHQAATIASDEGRIQSHLLNCFVGTELEGASRRCAADRRRLLFRREPVPV